MRRLHCYLAVLGVVLTAPWIPQRASYAQEFYAGKTIRIIVGFPAGGGFDTYSRVLGRHISKYIPGNPAVVVDNVTGAGSLIAANTLYKTAKPDGLTIGNFIGNLISQQLFGGPGIEPIGAPHLAWALIGNVSFGKWLLVHYFSHAAVSLR